MGRQKGDPRLKEDYKNNPKMKNLTERTPEELRAISAKGGKARQAQEAKRRQFREAAKALLWHSLRGVPEEEEIVSTLKEMGIEDPTGADAIMLAQYLKARRGDTEAARFIRDTAGEKPSQQVELNLLDKPIDAIDFSTLDDAQLEMLAAARNLTLIAGPVIEVEAEEETVGSTDERNDPEQPVL